VPGQGKKGDFEASCAGKKVARRKGESSEHTDDEKDGRVPEKSDMYKAPS